ncbi:MAG: SH3 domain-containing protein [Lachnospiraceae bacterium]|nr:SH3 domain-containing protein [Lachnospiraceae bacterium]
MNKLADLVLAHTRIIMPVILVACVMVTVIIAINARDRAGTVGAAIPQGEYVPDDIELPDSILIPEYPLELNKYPEVNALIKEYYLALAEGDSVRASELSIDLGELEMIRIEEMAKYIDYYHTVDVYTKPGLTENTYIAYVSSRVKFYEMDALLPGMQGFYLMPNDEGDLIIRKNLDENALDEKVVEYVHTLLLRDNVIDLYNKVNVEFNDMMAEDKELEEFIGFMMAKIDENVGIVLAQSVQPDITADQLRNDPDDDNENGTNTENDTQETVPVTVLARAIEVVNIRSSDSETADRLGRAIIGEEFTVLEQKGNGWSRISFNNRDAYIKSEFLEIIGEIGGQASSAETDGRVRVTSSNVRVRASASTSGNIIGTANRGDRFDFVETVSGWAKIIYNNEIGYIRNDFIEREN